jgi:hypothetical protein
MDPDEKTTNPELRFVAQRRDAHPLAVHHHAPAGKIDNP